MLPTGVLSPRSQFLASLEGLKFVFVVLVVALLRVLLLRLSVGLARRLQEVAVLAYVELMLSLRVACVKLYLGLVSLGVLRRLVRPAGSLSHISRS